MSVNVTQTEEERARTQSKRDAIIQQVLNSTPEQIENYIDTNVTDLASAKEFLKKTTKLLVVIAKQVDRLS